METIYRTREGDILDDICYRYYGHENAFIDVLRANYGLCDQGTVLPANAIIVLPALAGQSTTDEMVQLWD